MTKEPLYGILNADGTLQVESNDRKIRIVLSHISVFDEDRQIDAFRSTYYVKDGFEWQQALNSANYNSTNDFLDAIRYSDEFMLAVRDIEQQTKHNRDLSIV